MLGVASSLGSMSKVSEVQRSRLTTIMRPCAESVPGRCAAGTDPTATPASCPSTSTASTRVTMPSRVTTGSARGAQLITRGMHRSADHEVSLANQLLDHECDSDDSLDTRQILDHPAVRSCHGAGRRRGGVAGA